jgi:hypothetical protein
VAVSNAQGTGELVRAALLGVGVAAIAALRTVPWAALRARLNARRALPAVGGRGSL